MLRPNQSVMELGYRHMAALAGVFLSVERWWRALPNPVRSLGDLLKILPSEVVQHVEMLLRWARFLPPLDPARPQE